MESENSAKDLRNTIEIPEKHSEEVWDAQDSLGLMGNTREYQGFEESPMDSQ